MCLPELDNEEISWSLKIKTALFSRSHHLLEGDLHAVGAVEDEGANGVRAVIQTDGVLN